MNRKLSSNFTATQSLTISGQALFSKSFVFPIHSFFCLFFFKAPFLGEKKSQLSVAGGPKCTEIDALSYLDGLARPGLA